MLKKGSSGGIYIHAWDITDEGIDNCFDYLGDTCGLNEVYVAAIYHDNTFVLPHNPKRIVRWADGAAYFTPQHPRWSETRIRPGLGEGVDTAGYMHNIVDNARRRGWGVQFFTVFNHSVSLAQKYPEACCVDAMGERHRAYLCPSNPDVRGYNLAAVEDLMGTYGGDAIRPESLGFGPWNLGFVFNKVDVLPSVRDQYLLSLCFCGSCIQRARDEGVDPNPLRQEIRRHLYESLNKPASDWDTGPVDEEWGRNAFDGKLWEYAEVRCNTATSLFLEVQNIVDRYGGGVMHFTTASERRIVGQREELDYSKLYHRLKRVSIRAMGNTAAEKRASIVEQVGRAPEHAEPEMLHYAKAAASMEELRDEVLMSREAGVVHHAFHYYGMTPRYKLNWIGQARAAWS